MRGLQHLIFYNILDILLILRKKKDQLYKLLCNFNALTLLDFTKSVCKFVPEEKKGGDRNL